MIRHIEDEAINVLDIPTLTSFRKANLEYISSKKNAQKKDIFYKSLKLFFEWYISYCDSSIKKTILMIILQKQYFR